MNETQIKERVFARLDGLMKLVTVRHLVVAAFDGVAPRAKMNQQRARRVVAAKARLGKQFDTNCFTPGTEVMMSVTGKWLEEYFVARLRDGRIPSHIRCVVSDSSVPGEGEHKLQEFLRQLRAVHGEEGAPPRVGVYGGDADLVFLGALSGCPVKVIREVKDVCGRCGNGFHRQMLCPLKRGEGPRRNTAQPAAGPDSLGYEVVDLVRFLEIVRSEFGTHSQHHFLDVFRDLTVVSFIIGNDFVPRNVFLNARELHRIWNAYRVFLEQHPGSFLTRIHDGTVQFHGKNMAHFLQTVVDMKEGERQGGFRQFEKDRRKDPSRRFEEMEEDFNNNNNNEIDGRMKMVEALTKGTDRYQLWRASYIRRKFGTLERYSDSIKCYLRTWLWTITYYSFGVKDWDWFYPYHYAPLLGDVSAYLLNIGSQEWLSADFKETAPLLPLQQLFCVLPLESADLLPSSFAQHMHETQTAADQEFVVDDEYSAADHDVKVLLAFQDHSVVIPPLNNLPLSEEEGARNRVGGMVLLKHASCGSTWRLPTSEGPPLAVEGEDVLVCPLQYNQTDVPHMPLASFGQPVEARPLRWSFLARDKNPRERVMVSGFAKDTSWQQLSSHFVGERVVFARIDDNLQSGFLDFANEGDAERVVSKFNDSEIQKGHRIKCEKKQPQEQKVKDSDDDGDAEIRKKFGIPAACRNLLNLQLLESNHISLVGCTAGDDSKLFDFQSEQDDDDDDGWIVCFPLKGLFSVKAIVLERKAAARKRSNSSDTALTSVTLAKAERDILRLLGGNVQLMTDDVGDAPKTMRVFVNKAVVSFDDLDHAQWSCDLLWRQGEAIVAVSPPPGKTFASVSSISFHFSGATSLRRIRVYGQTK